MIERKDGPFIEYWQHGPIRTKGAYVGGLIDGPFEEYYANEELWIKCTYDHGLKNGLYEEYYSDGQIKERCTYKDAAEDGPYEKYSSDGQLEEVSIYKKGHLIKSKDRFFEAQEVLPDWEKKHPNPTVEDFLSHMIGTDGNVITCIVRAGLETLDRFFPSEKWATLENIPTLTKIFGAVPRKGKLLETMLRFDRKLQTTYNFNQRRAERERKKQQDMAIAKQHQQQGDRK